MGYGELLSIGQDVMGRVTENSAIRAGAARQVIEWDIQAHEEQGEDPRSDGFFDERGALRPEAHELLEAILLAAANCFEERKIPYLAHMFSEVSYDASVSGSDALFLARVADQVTFRQLQARAISGQFESRTAELQVEIGQIDASHKDGSMLTEPAFLREIDDLGDRRLVGIWTGDGSVTESGGRFGTKMSDSFGQSTLTETGKLLHRLMRLGDMPEADQREWVETFRGRPRVPSGPPG